MAKVEAIAYISRVPEEIMESIRDGDYKLTRDQGEGYVREGVMRKEILNLLIGAACLSNARKISQMAKKLEKIGEIPPELKLMRDNLSHWGAIMIFDNLYKLGTY